MSRFKHIIFVLLIISKTGNWKDIENFRGLNTINLKKAHSDKKEASIAGEVSRFFCSDELSFYNLQFPVSSSTITVGGVFEVYAQAFEMGLTESSGQGSGIEVWIGYNSISSSHPPDATGWTWIPATFNVNVGNNDEYVADIGSSLPIGTYYYASRFRLNGCSFTYGGPGGSWNNNSVELIVEPDQVNFANVQFPKTATINQCQSVEVFAQVYEPGVTEGNGQGANIQVWIGYIKEDVGIDEDYSPLNPGWTWVEATYNPFCLDCNDQGGIIQNDEYSALIGENLPPGKYYYASRVQLNGSDFSYGGIIENANGNFWGFNDGNGQTYNNGSLEINGTTLADVSITEIMYNTDGTDDEWIEICNVSGISQDLSLHLITSSAGAEFRFPCGTIINNDECVTVALGSDGDGVFNNDTVTTNPGHCPFVPDFGIDSNTLDSNNLANGSGTVSILSPNAGLIIDEVNYSSSDGGNDNGKSLHVVDISQDNSSTTSNWQEVDLGGSSGINSLIPNCLPNTAEIKVEGNRGTFPDIPDGDVTPSGLDNTLFSSQFVGATQSKSYRISSLGSTDISISSVSLAGDTVDFSITQPPDPTISYGMPSFLEITFAPLSAGVKTAVVTILNNDDNPSKKSYTFTIQGAGTCFDGGSSILPQSGPAGTVVTISGNNLDGAIAKLNGISMQVRTISDLEIEAKIPENTSTGIIEITDSLGCKSFVPFTVIDSIIGGCEESPPGLNEIFISEITDATYGSLTFVELYNPSNSPINLSDYSLRIFFNGNTQDYSEQNLSNTINAKEAFVIATGTSGALCSPLIGDEYDLLSSVFPFGINAGIGKDDYIGLYKNGVLIDEWGVFGDDNWTNTTSITGDKGFNFKRKNVGTNLPTLPFILNDWNLVDWVGSGLNSCNTNNYSDVGLYDFSTGSSPSVIVQPNLPETLCEQSINISVLGEEGLEDNIDLTYQWYYLAPGDSNWTIVTNNSIYNNATSNTLQILNTYNLDGYQYYCQVRENDESCYKASNAVRIKLKKATWQFGNWENGISPDSETITIINDDYDTSSQSSFNSCQLFVEADHTLTITNDHFVEVKYHIYSEGTIIVETAGSLVQNSDIATVSGNGVMRVNKTTSMLETVHDYTYWSSPINQPLINEALNNSNPNRRFWFNAQNFIDRFKETNNNNALDPGQDDVDDDGNVWQRTTSNEMMKNGLGYAATHNPALYTGPNSYPYSFIGNFNTGIIEVDIFRNDEVIEDNSWNLIGNPYPSSINITEFLTENTFNSIQNPGGSIEGAIYIWSQTTPPSSTNNGSEQINFSQNDYIIVNAIGAVTPNSNGDTINGFIPSGQGFFVSMSQETNAIEDLGNNIKRTSVRFLNSMRDVGNNNQFFRGNTIDSGDKIWLNLASDGGLFSQILIGYINGASQLFDGAFFDAKRTHSGTVYGEIYSIIAGYKGRFAIQGKALTDLNENEIIPIGFRTDIQTGQVYNISIDHFEGDFITHNPVYIIDNYKGIIHNLKNSKYFFTSESGTFEDRFMIAFSTKSLSLNKPLASDNKLKIKVLENDRIEFKVGKKHQIATVSIYDLSGKLILNLPGNSFLENYYLPQLKSGTYVTTVELLDNTVLRSKIIIPD